MPVGEKSNVVKKAFSLVRYFWNRQILESINGQKRRVPLFRVRICPVRYPCAVAIRDNGVGWLFLPFCWYTCLAIRRSKRTRAKSSSAPFFMCFFRFWRILSASFLYQHPRYGKHYFWFKKGTCEMGRLAERSLDSRRDICARPGLPRVVDSESCQCNFLFPFRLLLQAQGFCRFCKTQCIHAAHSLFYFFPAVVSV